jgi:hypothetical protein
MRPDAFLRHEFVEYIPETLAEGTVYVSIPFATVVHKCVCGCGKEVVTPLTPTDWKLIFDGDTISLDPSIGNWSFDCQSHYWITKNRVRWSYQWTKGEVERSRAQDRLAKRRAFEEPQTEAKATVDQDLKNGFWRKVGRRFRLRS